MKTQTEVVFSLKDFVEFGRQGGKKRAANMTAAARRRSAIKASKAAAKARSQKAGKQ